MMYRAACIGIGNLALAPLFSYALLRLSPAGAPVLFFALFAMLAAALNALLWRMTRGVAGPAVDRRGWRLFWIVAAINAAGFLVRVWINPLGNFDGPAFWNAKAHAITADFLLGETPSFSEDYWVHPGYPLALPLLLSASGVALGGWSDFIPIVFHFLLFLLTMGMLGEQAFAARSVAPDWRLRFASLIHPLGFLLASNLAADFALIFAFCFLTTVAIRIFEGQATMTEVILAGAAGAFLLNLKNEGALIVLCAFALIVYAAARRRRLAALSASLLPLLAGAALLLLFKLSAVAPAPMPGRAEDIVTRLFSFERYVPILQAFWIFHLIVMAGLVLVWLFALRKCRERTLFLPLLGLHLLYGAVFVMTEYDQAWHIGTGFARLQFTLFFPFVLLGVYVANDMRAKDDG